MGAVTCRRRGQFSAVGATTLLAAGVQNAADQADSLEGNMQIAISAGQIHQTCVTPLGLPPHTPRAC